MGNIFSSLPDKLEHESFEELLRQGNAFAGMAARQGIVAGGNLQPASAP